MARALSELGYDARVIGGGTQTLEEAYWNAHVVAFPSERTDLRAHWPALIDPAVNA